MSFFIQLQVFLKSVCKCKQITILWMHGFWILHWYGLKRAFYSICLNQNNLKVAFLFYNSKESLDNEYFLSQLLAYLIYLQAFNLPFHVCFKNVVSLEKPVQLTRQRHEPNWTVYIYIFTYCVNFISLNHIWKYNSRLFLCTNSCSVLVPLMLTELSEYVTSQHYQSGRKP